jgi:diaminohydroxyphosphoribosylaminopyrimidine deaminase/5-amino-6-(5-phosphoribosylamino)uracil reductase
MGLLENSMTTEEIYMHRCLQLARMGAGSVAPNPMVGAVLVYKGRIIGEGYHKKFGSSHAEPECINSVAEADKALIPGSTLYVSLEPCAHFGKTPPCTDLVISQGIKKVVIATRDPFEEVNGKGIEKLQAAGIEVKIGLLEKEAIEINHAFFTFHTKKRPWIILKWAQTADGFIGRWRNDAGSRLFISNEITNRLVHKWRSETASIMVGTNTARQDDPSLNTRFWKGKSPVRLVIDRNLKLPVTSKLFDKSSDTIVFNYHRSGKEGNIHYHRLDGRTFLVQQVMDNLYDKKINSLLVEGGAQLLQSFIDLDLWDEARIITNRNMYVHNGVKAPVLKRGEMKTREYYGEDEVAYLVNAC